MFMLEEFFMSGIGSAVKAFFLLLIAFVVAEIVKGLVKKMLQTGKISAALGKIGSADEASGIVSYICRLAYFLVFLLFVPSIFAAVGVDSVAAPITGLLNQVWSFLPKLLAAGIVLFVGFLIARLVRELLIPLFQRLQLDKLQEKSGVQLPDSGRLSATLAYIVYVLILIPVVIVALQVLDIEAISAPAVHMLSIVFDFIPSFVIGLLLILVGCVIGNFIGEIVRRIIAATGFDGKLSALMGEQGGRFVLSAAAGMTVRVVLIIFFVVQGLNVLQLEVLTEIGTAVIGYLPNVLAAVILIALCLVLGSIAERGLKESGYGSLALLSRWAIMLLGCFMILNQLKVAPVIVNSAFILIVAALAVAFALAFGVGGREFAAGLLKRLMQKLDESKKSEP